MLCRPCANSSRIKVAPTPCTTCNYYEKRKNNFIINMNFKISIKETIIISIDDALRLNRLVSLEHELTNNCCSCFLYSNSTDKFHWSFISHKKMNFLQIQNSVSHTNISTTTSPPNHTSLHQTMSQPITTNNTTPTWQSKMPSFAWLVLYVHTLLLLLNCSATHLHGEESLDSTISIKSLWCCSSSWSAVFIIQYSSNNSIHSG